MKIDKTIINGSTLSIICSGRFGIGSEGNSSAQLIRNELESAIHNTDNKITEIEIDFRMVEYEWGDGPITAIMSVINPDLKIKYLANEQNTQPLNNLLSQSGLQKLFTIEIVKV